MAILRAKKLVSALVFHATCWADKSGNGIQSKVSLPGGVVVGEVAARSRPVDFFAKISTDGHDGREFIHSRLHGKAQLGVPQDSLKQLLERVGGTNPETVVTVELKDKDGGTELTLSQTGFTTVSSAKGHEEGPRQKRYKLQCFRG